MMRLVARLGVVLALVLSLVSCAPQPAAESDAGSLTKPALALAAGEQRYVIDDSTSQLLVYTYRGGKLARFGHNHVLNAQLLAGEVALATDITGSRFQLEVPLAGIEVDNPTLRAAAGPEFNSKPSPEDVAATRANMLGPDGLDATVAPAAVIQGTVIEVSGARAMLDMRVTVRETTHRQAVEVTVVTDTDSLRISGTTALMHSDFGIAPFSVMLGALTVKDKVDIRFELVARPAT